MSSTRVAFDLERPFIVAAQELVYGPKQFVRGEPFPWRELGVSELDLLQLHSFFKVDCVGDDELPGFVPGGSFVVPPAPAAPKPKRKPRAPQPTE